MTSGSEDGWNSANTRSALFALHSMDIIYSRCEICHARYAMVLPDIWQKPERKYFLCLVYEPLQNAWYRSVRMWQCSGLASPEAWFWKPLLGGGARELRSAQLSLWFGKVALSGPRWRRKKLEKEGWTRWAQPSSIKLGKIHTLRLDVPYGPLYWPTRSDIPWCLFVEVATWWQLWCVFLAMTNVPTTNDRHLREVSCTSLLYAWLVVCSHASHWLLRRYTL